MLQVALSVGRGEAVCRRAPVSLGETRRWALSLAIALSEFLPWLTHKTFFLLVSLSSTVHPQ